MYIFTNTIHVSVKNPSAEVTCISINKRDSKEIPSRSSTLLIGSINVSDQIGSERKRPLSI